MLNFFRTKVLVFLALLLCAHMVSGQEIGIDRKGKSIFTYYSKEDKRFSFTADGNLAYAQIFHARDVVYEKPENHDITVKKFAAWTYRIALTSEEDLLSSEKLSKLRPGLQFKIGRQTSIDTFLHLDHNLPTSKGSVKTYGGNLILELANTKLYDSVTNRNSKKYPGTVGLEGNFNFIFKNKDSNSKHRIILAFNGSLVNTYNDDELISYQNLAAATIRPPIVTLEELEGKFGRVRRVNDLRFSVSLPMYFGHLNPIPYIVYNARTHSRLAYYTGVFLNFLNPVLNQRSFQIPSTFGIGVDCKYSGDKFSKPVFFLKGELKF